MSYWITSSQCAIPFPVIVVLLTLLPLSALYFYSHYYINVNTAASANVKDHFPDAPLLLTPIKTLSRASFRLLAIANREIIYIEKIPGINPTIFFYKFPCFSVCISKSACLLLLTITGKTSNPRYTECFSLWCDLRLRSTAHNHCVKTRLLEEYFGAGEVK